jgi:hypothetical protein
MEDKSLECILNAKVGDIARVCFRVSRTDSHGMPSSYCPTSELTEHQFNFPIIDIHDTGSSRIVKRPAYPIIGVSISNPISYSMTPASARHEKLYRSTYILYPSDIRTVKIFKLK